MFVLPVPDDGAVVTGCRVRGRTVVVDNGRVTIIREFVVNNRPFVDFSSATKGDSVGLDDFRAVELATISCVGSNSKFSSSISVELSRPAWILQMAVLKHRDAI